MRVDNTRKEIAPARLYVVDHVMITCARALLETVAGVMYSDVQ